MDKEIKLLNKQYLETKLRDIYEIKRRVVLIEFEDTDRAFSKSLYINFICKSDKDWKCHTLRISDHELKGCPHTQFIIEPDEDLTKKTKKRFLKVVESCIKKALNRHFYKELEKISKEVAQNVDTEI